MRRFYEDYGFAYRYADKVKYLNSKDYGEDLMYIGAEYIFPDGY